MGTGSFSFLETVYIFRGQALRDFVYGMSNLHPSSSRISFRWAIGDRRFVQLLVLRFSGSFYRIANYVLTCIEKLTGYPYAVVTDISDIKKARYDG